MFGLVLKVKRTLVNTVSWDPGLPTRTFPFAYKCHGYYQSGIPVLWQSEASQAPVEIVTAFLQGFNEREDE